MKGYLELAYREALNSRDPSTQNGALIVSPSGYNNILTWAYNRFPKGVEETGERWERPLKYQVIEHAERNAIFNLARSGISTKDKVLVCPWAACADCARAIVQSGISILIRHKQASERSPGTWIDSIAIADQMMHEAGVEIIDYDGKVGNGIELLHGGELWQP